MRLAQLAVLGLLVPAIAHGESEQWYEVVSELPGPEVTDSAMRQQIEASGHPWKVRDRATGSKWS